MQHVSENTEEIVVDEFDYTHNVEVPSGFIVGNVLGAPVTVHGKKSPYIKWNFFCRYRGSDNVGLNIFANTFDFQVVGYYDYAVEYGQIEVRISAELRGSQGESLLMGVKSLTFENTRRKSSFGTASLRTNSKPNKINIRWKFQVVVHVGSTIHQTVPAPEGNVPVEALQKSLKDLLEMNIGDFADVTFVTPDGNVPAHKVLLSARSPVFRAMFSTNMVETSKNEVKITDFDKKIVFGMLEYIYTGRTDKVKGNPEEMLHIADKYDLKELREACIPIVTSSVKVENAISKLLLADRFHLKEFKEVMMQFFKTNHLEIAKSPNFEEFVKTNYPLYLEALTGKVADRK